MYKHRLTLAPLLLLGATSLACAAEIDTTENDSAAASPSAGQAIATLITQNYNNVVENCGEGKPAYLCSGITLRGTSPKLNRFALDPSPASVKSGGISFSFMRKDSAFWKLAWGYKNGFILYNKNNTPGMLENNLNSLCFFPEDGGTDIRSDAGCGAAPDFPDTSGPCQAQGITTAEQWKKHFDAAPSGKNKWHHQCGFNTQESSEYDNADIFTKE
ncbi:Uncharacterised protein [Serratia ficaria]|uniref:hypothetical protein n=1 Tax=Serratia ficaria TaxID=61651 RepID=UPI00217BE565|nr:hypothetical protein [Serratia ficaria]CAI2092341.1 Uncharacterised protein [Serratia ficaria]CAI2463921.1 Uncharacterised protein [Serratia ficaria]